MSIIAITKENFESQVLQAKGQVLLDFWAPWCGPCQMIAPAIEEIAQENEQLTVGKINVDEQVELALRYGITSIPTLLVVENGQVTQKAIGYRAKASIEQMLK